MRHGLEKLSTEILVEVLSYLHYTDLLNCRQVGRRYNIVIRHTPALKYAMELGMAGYKNGSSSYNVVHRLDTLQQERRIWRYPQPKHARSFVIPSEDWFDARCYKDVVCGRVPDNRSRLDIFHLSTTVPEDKRVQRLYLDIAFDAVYIDPGQDLLILTASARVPDASGLRPPPRLHLKSLKTQKPHPNAKEAVIDLASYGFPPVSFVRRVKVQVSGDYLTLTVLKSLAVEAILVWHWPSGTVTAALRSSSDVAFLTAFCTDDGHLLVNRHLRHAGNGFGIHVYALHLTDEVPSLLATFELPKLNWDLSSWLNSSFFPGFRTYGSIAGGIGAGPLQSQPWHSLVQLRVDLQYTLYTPLTTFLAEPVLQNQRRSSPLRFSWAEWGPKHTRVLHEETESPVVCGYKAIYADRVLDFCPVTDLVGGLASDASVTVEPTVLTSTIFAEDVVTHLPYREAPLDFPRRLAGNEMQLFFVDQDGPKVARATCEFILIPTNVEVFSLVLNDDEGE